MKNDFSKSKKFTFKSNSDIIKAIVAFVIFFAVVFLFLQVCS